jgi:hypothetical protein
MGSQGGDFIKETFAFAVHQETEMGKKIGANEFIMGYQPRNNLVKDENGDLLANSRNVLNRWKNYFS